ncbi:deSI-like protein At4g17486 isoform X1 [Phoenix dactylifera]|uniref:DeSI-like protein At4g17486 isoform X1 n=1 Tax=Phoenix dactylifera TaxID=42345 RepID=A0A8B7CTV4_PHODC|nr:deSI-like protein At4g17486 isoform X1 [Phoenix dactylifera]
MVIRGRSGKRKTGTVPVYLNVYDLTPINVYAYWLGLGVYHSGVQVHGVEFAYGAHGHATTGIFDGEPRQCLGFVFRKSILIGRTDLGPREVRALMEELATEYTGNTYNLISKNCNHFCNDACLRLTNKPIPRWVNRLAKIGAFPFTVDKSPFSIQNFDFSEVSEGLLVEISRFSFKLRAAGASGGGEESGRGSQGKPRRGEGEAEEQLHSIPSSHHGFFHYYCGIHFHSSLFGDN